MQKPLPYFQSQRLVSKYRKLKLRLDKALKENRFKDFSERKQRQVLSKIEKLKNRLANMQQVLKLSGSALTLGFALFTVNAQAQTPVAEGSEFKVNNFTLNTQHYSAIATDSDGDFVITWASLEQDKDGYGIYAQRYNAARQAQGNEFQVNTYTASRQWVPSVAMDSDGDFVIAWMSKDQEGIGSGYGIYAQRYNAIGQAQGNEFLVNTFTKSNQKVPSVAMDSDGDFVITWASQNQDGSGDGIFAQCYNAAGQTQGSEFQVNNHTESGQSSPSVAIDSDGDFVITWNSLLQDGDETGIYARRFSASGLPKDEEFLVNTYTTSFQRFPSVAMDSDGDFVITWASKNEDQDLGGYGIYARRYNVSGISQGGEFKVNSYTASDLEYPSVAMDNDGDFVIVWRSKNQDGNNYGVYGQRFNSSGQAKGIEFQVNTYTTDAQEMASVAIDSNGDFIVCWESQGQDGSGNGIFAQRFSMPEATGFLTDALVPTNEINVYPNPSTGAFNIDAVGKSLVEYTVTIIDALGATVYKGKYTEQLSLDHLPKGLYNLRLENENDVIVKQIVIE